MSYLTLAGPCHSSATSSPGWSVLSSLQGMVPQAVSVDLHDSPFEWFHAWVGPNTQRGLAACLNAHSTSAPKVQTLASCLSLAVAFKTGPTSLLCFISHLKNEGAGARAKPVLGLAVMKTCFLSADFSMVLRSQPQRSRFARSLCGQAVAIYPSEHGGMSLQERAWMGEQEKRLPEVVSAVLWLWKSNLFCAPVTSISIPITALLVASGAQPEGS